ncbi:o-succinylbenzoate--CoA ligase [Cytobacillus suaedae]|nr:o-succinylbenzoate--CoA ligase [Cytobacillus suaedae]
MNNNVETPNWLANRAFLTPDRVAIKTDKESITFGELHTRTLSFARQLSSLGVSNGEMVALLMRNSIEMVVAIHALKYIGTTTVLLNTRLTSHELLWQLEDSKPNLILTEEFFSERIESIKDKMDGSILHTIEEIKQVSEKNFELVSTYNLDLVDTIMYTSGTTGKPKGVFQTYGNHWWSAIGSALNIGLHEKDIWLSSVPLFHISGLSILMRSVIYGITVVLHETFNPEEVNHSILKNDVTIISVVSTMLSQMIDCLGENKYPTSLRCVLLGGGPAPKPLLEACRDKSIPVYQTYGMTETSSQVVTLSPEYSLQKLGSAGKPLFPVQVKVVEEGKEVLPNQSGEIVVKGPNVTKGYLNREDATADSIRNGWLYTGDIGYLDNDGFLYVLDRRSDLIVSGGENVYPAEIESVLLSHPYIKEAGVTGINDPIWGQVPCAFIRLENLSNLTVEEILTYCQERLAKYKVPKQVFFVNELPRNASNKLIRKRLLDLLN